MIHKSPVDAWSIAHFVAGVLFALYAPFDIVQFTFINIGWEIFEHYFKQFTFLASLPFLAPLRVPESAINKTMDILIAEAGWVCTMYYLHGRFY